MKQTVLYSLLLLVSTSLFAQIGIGTTSPKAILDITSPTSGMLVPRYATLAAANANSLPTLNATDHKGMIIYVIEASNQGFWFYDGSSFVRVGTPTNALPIANGGTGATTASSALNALLPAQNDNASKVLTSDGTNASWQKPSRTRSISLGVGDFDIIPDELSYAPSKKILLTTPVIAFAQKSYQAVQISVPIPADWDGTSPFTFTCFYTSKATPGTFLMAVQPQFLFLDSDIRPTVGTHFLFFLTPASSTENGLMQFTTTLTSIYSPSSPFKVLAITIYRDGTNRADTAAADFNLLGVRIDYHD